MKTKYIASIAAVLGVAATLNISALAGPDPQSLSGFRNVSAQKNVTTIGLFVRSKAPATAKPATKTVPTLSYVSGPHGDHYIYRR